MNAHFLGTSASTVEYRFFDPLQLTVYIFFVQMILRIINIKNLKMFELELPRKFYLVPLLVVFVVFFGGIFKAKISPDTTECAQNTVTFKLF
jgi:hypothetical protein